MGPGVVSGALIGRGDGVAESRTARRYRVMHGGADAESVAPAARPVSSCTKAANDAKCDGSVAVRHDPRRYRDIARHAMIPHLAVDRSHVMTEIVTLQQRASRPFFAVLLPLLFATCCALGVVWPGHG